MTGRVRAQFIGGTTGRIFSILREPATGGGGDCVLFVPPFAEEMNKCRRQVTEAAIALADRGWHSLCIDLYGSGDSEGEFADARWQTWKSDVSTACEWASESGLKVNALVGTRMGCTLAARSLSDSGISVSASVFWQPIDSGQRLMKQFLRLRVAASMMESDRRESLDDLQKRLDSGETIEVAGYALAPELWRSLSSLEAADCLDDCLGKLLVVEIGRRDGDVLSPAGLRLVESAAERGIVAMGRRFAGDAFWRSTEIVVVPGLAESTAEYIQDAL